MPCLIALLVLGVLSIFSAKYRILAKEAFDCVFRRVTLRPCNTGFDIKVKSAILSKLLVKSPKVAKMVSKNFEIVSWVFMVALTLSSLYSLRGLYNYWAWGDCNGPYATGGFCAFDPTGLNSKITDADDANCKDVSVASRNISIDGFDTSKFYTTVNELVATHKPKMVFLGCYSCDYTRQAYPLFQKLLEKYPVEFTFAHFPVKSETKYLQPYDVCVYEQSPEAFWKYVELMFYSAKWDIAEVSYVERILRNMNLDMDALHRCIVSEETQKKVREQNSEMLGTGIYGTPTVFIDGTAIVGPKPERVYTRLLKD